jgi:putative redox protein
MTAVGATSTAVELNRITDDDPTGTPPMELLLEAVAGCSSIDVILILEEKSSGYRL